MELDKICENCGSLMARIKVSGQYFWRCGSCGPQFREKVESVHSNFSDENAILEKRKIREIPPEKFVCIVTPQKLGVLRIFSAMTRHYLTLVCPQCGAEIDYRDVGNALHERTEAIVCPLCGCQLPMKQEVVGGFFLT